MFFAEPSSFTMQFRHDGAPRNEVFLYQTILE